MSQINLSLEELFHKHNGGGSNRFKPRFPDLPEENKYGRYGSPYFAVDLVGRWYNMPVEVQVGDDKAEDFGVTDETGAYTGRWFLPYPVISAELNTHIVDTELTERDGMVSELISLSNFKIHIKGMLINTENGGFPEDDFNIMNRLVGLKTPIRLNNPMTDILMSYSGGDKWVTIRSLKFPEHPGVNNIRPYELELMTEVPFSLIDIGA